MSITLKGHILNQRQLTAITPVFNDLIQQRITQDQFEQACVDALVAAGCPIGYGTGINPASSIAERAIAWRENGRVGASSLAIWRQMTGSNASSTAMYCYPLDPADLNRCLLLLDLIPEWAPRMGEMAAHGPQWAAMAARWDEIAGLFLEEAGLDFSKSGNAPKTYALMRQVIGGAQ